jgi:coenzyme F420-0:L-glutamate ligase/coenzyme F420-1:gamma-L-glutamate ligase
VTLQILPVPGIGAVRPGDEPAEVLAAALDPLQPLEGDVLVVTHKIVSKAEGMVVAIDGVEEAFKRALVESEAAAIVRRRGDLIIAETKHGFICANAGVDRPINATRHHDLLPGSVGASDRVRCNAVRDRSPSSSAAFGRPWRRGSPYRDRVSGLRASIRGLGNRTGGIESRIAVADEFACRRPDQRGRGSRALIRGWRGRAARQGQTWFAPEEDLFR